MPTNPRFLVLGATAKTGRRVAEKLIALGHDVRAVSRSTTPAFDWTDPKTWDDALRDRDAVYVTFQPDLAVPGSDDIIASFAKRALMHGAKRIVMLSGRGEEAAHRAEDALRHSGADATVLRANWFFQNFNEDLFLPYIQQGTLALPAGDTPEPFVDANDIAECAVACLLDQGHIGKTYELSGPSAVTFADVTEMISSVANHPVSFVAITVDELDAGLEADGMPDEVRGLIRYLFSEVLDGRNSQPTSDVYEILGRQPNSLRNFVEEAAKTGIWDVAKRA
ncbi:MAG: NAD(P)H-binding protein [Thalassospira sp.]|uniref:NAD(P)H-binding protein n=1 Tax=Thalassospira sp. TaxID=1912094 RepID=UPI001B273210|nr:NAD(P)H-binding protein [Thalassospira sp.]MBO6580835.1 NAD(P)H-binding protein [Thalassospira sp.]MBO6804055.1 NAD(P)H-binding protein [Thalassospira sp.]MBO6819275.1 NAD(P)H-binding protein [Thalassospira sp.]MBO6888730.1 NAD(P)H-binding protein [Thalassospira sp.]